MSVSQIEGPRRSPMRFAVVLLLAGSAALTAALVHLGYQYLRVGEVFARLILH